MPCTTRPLAEVGQRHLIEAREEQGLRVIERAVQNRSDGRLKTASSRSREVDGNQKSFTKHPSHLTEGNRLGGPTEPPASSGPRNRLQNPDFAQSPESASNHDRVGSDAGGEVLRSPQGVPSFHEMDQRV